MHRYFLLILRHQCKLRLDLVTFRDVSNFIDFSTTLPTYLSLPNSNWSNFDHFAHLLIFAKLDQLDQLDQLDRLDQLVELDQFDQLVQLIKLVQFYQLVQSVQSVQSVLLQYQSKSYYIIGQEVYYSIGRFITLSGSYYIIGSFFITLSGSYYSIGRLLHYRLVQQ